MAEPGAYIPTAPSGDYESVASLESSEPRKTCDQCRRRKVRCDGAHPCRRCFRSFIQCTRAIPAQRRGPKPGNGSVIVGLRALERPRSPTTSLDLLTSDTWSNIHTFGPTSIPNLLMVGDDNEAESASGDEDQWQDSANMSRAPDAWPNPRHGDALTASERTMDDLVPVPDGEHDLARAPELVDHRLPAYWHPGTHELALGAEASGSEVSSCTSMQPRTLPLLAAGLSMSRYVSSGIRQVSQNIAVSPFIIRQCMDIFFDRLLPVMPVLQQHALLSDVMQGFTESDECVVVAICALTLLRSPVTYVQTRQTGSHLQLAQHMIRRCQQLRLGFSWLSSSGGRSAIVSYFIALCCFDLQQPAAQRHYLREARELAHGPDGPSSPHEPAPSYVDERCRHFLSDLLYITEVSSAIQRHHDTSSSADDDRLSILLESDDVVSNGLGGLYHIFYLLDHSVLQCPGHIHDDATSGPCRERLVHAQHRLNLGVPYRSHASQRADFLVTKEWARLIVWNAAIAHGLVCAAESNVAFRYDFPAVVAKALCTAMQTLPLEDVYIHGLGIHEKIFEIVNALLDMTIIGSGVPLASDELGYLYAFLSSSSTSRRVYIPILDTKLTEIQLEVEVAAC